VTKRRAAILLLAVFVVGAVCGAASMAAWIRTRGPILARLGEERAEQAAIRRISRRLDLDAEQRRVLQSIAADTRGRMQVFREETIQRMDQILDGAVEELLPILRDDQKAKLRQMREETRRKFHRHRHRHGGEFDGKSRRRGDFRGDDPRVPRER
jgi:hypothetical protein